MVVLPVLGLFDPPAGSSTEDVTGDAALVLAGDADGARLRSAVTLYEADGVSHVLLTGRGVGGDDAEYLKREAMRLGLPASALLVERSSTSTRGNILAAMDLVRGHGFRRVVLITSRSHMTRARLVARNTMPDVVWRRMAIADAGPFSSRYRARLTEWAKLGFYALRGWL